jgi:hypothetical protein
MTDPPTVGQHHLYPRAHTLQFAQPFPQSECTGGYLCGTAFQQQGCYATPDYSTCHFDASLGYSTCTVCICQGFDSGENGCDTSSPGTNTGGPSAGNPGNPSVGGGGAQLNVSAND